jgi:hypothetical protein
MTQFKVGQVVYAARIGYDGKVEVEQTTIAGIGPKQIKLVKRLASLGYGVMVQPGKISDTPRGALLRLLGQANDAVTNAESAVKIAQLRVRAVAEAIGDLASREEQS